MYSIPSIDSTRPRMAYPARARPWQQACAQPRRTFQHGTRVQHRSPMYVGLRGIVEPDTTAGPNRGRCFRLSVPFDGRPQVHVRWTDGSPADGAMSGWYDVTVLTVVSWPPASVLVAKGATLLDEREPGWYKLVDLDKLDMGSMLWCILAQTWTGPVERGPSPYTLHADALFPGDDNTEVCAHGFDAPLEDGPSLLELAAAWEDAVLARRGGGGR